VTSVSTETDDMNILNRKSLFHFPKRRTRAKDLRVPDEESHVRNSIVHRLNANNDRKKRLLILTKEDLLVALEGHDFIIDKIPLVFDTCMHCRILL
jgi:hypothetical protein